MVSFRYQKRIFDILFSAFLIVCALPIMLVIATIVFIDLRSVFFVQERVGQHGELFNIWKFRTMRKASRAEEHEVDYHNKRTTQVGAFLRKTKLDELPQLFQVLWGVMSIVGPRPELASYVKYHKSLRDRVLILKPGLIDFATLSHMNEDDLLAGQIDRENYYCTVILRNKLRLSKVLLSNQKLTTDLHIILLFLRKIFTQIPSVFSR